MLTLRRARLEDAKTLLEWRNDPLTRAMFTSTDDVALDGHVKWLTSKLTDPECRFYIAEEEGEPVGTLRLDGIGTAHVSWSVSPEHRGRGLCQEMARLALEGEPRVLAEVKQDNLACQRVLAAVGFSQVRGGEMQLWERLAAGIRREPSGTARTSR